MSFCQVELEGRGTLAPATPSSHPTTLPRPGTWCLFSQKLSRLLIRSSKNLLVFVDVVVVEDVEEAEVVAVVDMVVEEVVEDGE